MARRSAVPERIRWAVELLDVGPGDRILEIGCGPGVAAALVCDRLGTGHLTALDRSAVAVDRALTRNAVHVEAGRLRLHNVDLAGFGGAPACFDKAFAVNVNLFWTSHAEGECEVLGRVLRPGGVLLLVYGGAPCGGAGDVGPKVAATLGRHGFTTEVVPAPDGAMTCVAARTPA